MARTITFDFYRVKVEDKAGRSFPDLLEEMNAVDDRAQSRTDDAIRLQPVKKSHGMLRGDMLRIRLNEVPVKAKLSGETKEIDLAADEGIGEETAYLFHPNTRILVIQRNRIGVSAAVMAKYFRTLCKVRAVNLEMILKQDALERIRGMATIRTFEVHVAAPDRAEGLRGRGHSAKAMYDLLNDHQANNLTVKLSMGHKRGGLQNVIDTIVRLAGNQAEDPAVKKILVIGNEDEDDSEKTLIDLLQDRLTESVILEGDGSRVTSAQRFKALNAAWELHRDYLESLDASE